MFQVSAACGLHLSLKADTRRVRRSRSPCDARSPKPYATSL